MRRVRRASCIQAELGEAEINLTSLIDVVFVVLIIFILIAPLLEIDRVELASGKTATEQLPAREKSAVTVYVREDNTIWMEGVRVTTQHLLQRLREKRAHDRNVIPQLFQDQRASFGTYQNVKNVIEEAGYEQMDVILKPS